MKNFSTVSDILAMYQDEISEKYQTANNLSIEQLQAYTSGKVDISKEQQKTVKKFVPITEQLKAEGHTISYNVDAKQIDLFNISSAIAYTAQTFLQGKASTYSRIIEQRLQRRQADIFLTNYDLIRVDGVHYSHFRALQDFSEKDDKALMRECVIAVCNKHRIHNYNFSELPIHIREEVLTRYDKHYHGTIRGNIAKNTDRYIRDRFTDNHDYVMTAYSALLEGIIACNGETDTVIGYKPMQYDTKKYIVSYADNGTITALSSVNAKGELTTIVSKTSYRALLQINAELVISVTCITPFSLAFSAVSTELQRHEKAFNVQVNPDTIKSEGYVDNTLDNKIANNELLKQVFSLCTKTQKQYIDLYIRINPNTHKRFTYADIAKCYGVNKSSVSRAVNRVFSKAREQIKR